jgi:hypothetical protein
MEQIGLKLQILILLDTLTQLLALQTSAIAAGGNDVVGDTGVVEQNLGMVLRWTEINDLNTARSSLIGGRKCVHLEL